MPARVRLVEVAEAPDAVRSIYDEIEAVRGPGKVTPVFKALANIPEYLRAHWEYNKANNRKGKLTKKTKEMISVAVSVALGCKV